LEYVLEHDKEKSVNEKSWRHCLLFLVASGEMSEDKFKSHFALRRK